MLDCVLRGADDITDPTLDVDNPPAWELTEKHHSHRSSSQSSHDSDEMNSQRHQSENDVNNFGQYNDDRNYLGSLGGGRGIDDSSSNSNTLAAADVLSELVSQLSLGLITPTLAGDRAASAFAATHTLCFAASSALRNSHASSEYHKFAASSGNSEHSFNGYASSEDENYRSDSSTSRSRISSRHRSHSPSSQNQHRAATATVEAAVVAAWKVKRALRFLQHVVKGVSLDLALAASAASWARKLDNGSNGIGTSAVNGDNGDNKSNNHENGAKQASSAHAFAANAALSERVLLHFRAVMPVLGLTVLAAVRALCIHKKAVPSDFEEDKSAEEEEEEEEGEEEEDLLMDLVLPISVELCALFSAFLQPGETFEFASSIRNPVELMVTSSFDNVGDLSSRERTVAWAHVLQSKFLAHCNPNQRAQGNERLHADFNTDTASTATAAAASAMNMLLSGDLQNVNFEQFEDRHLQKGRQRRRSDRGSSSNDSSLGVRSANLSRSDNGVGGAYSTSTPSWEESRQRMALLLALALEPAAPATARFAGYCCSLGALGERKDHRVALRWWHVAAEQGDARACLNAGLLRQAGRAGSISSSMTRASREEESAIDAEAWFRLGAERGWPPAMLALALLLLSADGRDATDGRKHCDAHTTTFGNNRANTLHDTSIGRVEAAAAVAEGEQWALQAAELGDPDAQFLMASRLETKAMDDQLALDDAEAAPFSVPKVEAPVPPGAQNTTTTATHSTALPPGAANPTASSLSALAWTPVPTILQDVPHSRLIHPGALSWFQCAAAGGHPGAQFRLGVVHDEAFLTATTAQTSPILSPTILRHHAAEASRWLLLAAAQNHSWAMHRVAQLVSSGRLVDFTNTATGLIPDHINSSPYSDNKSSNDHRAGGNFRFWPVDNAFAARLLARASCPEAKFALGCLVADWPLEDSHKLAGVLPNHELLLLDDPQQDGTTNSSSSSSSSSRSSSCDDNNISSSWRGCNLAEAAVRLWREAAAEDCVDAAVLLGHMYHRGGCSTGMGIAEDRCAAEAYWRSAAEVGDLGAMVLLGELLLENAQIYATNSSNGDDVGDEESERWEEWNSPNASSMEAEAKAWWHEASARGSVEAAEKLKDWAGVEDL